MLSTKLLTAAIRAYFIKYDGTSTSLNCGSNVSLDNLHTGAFTLEAWVRRDRNGENNLGHLIRKGNGWSLFISTGSLRMVVFTDGTQADTSAALNHNIQHIAVTYNNGGDRRIRIYIGGVLAATSNAATGTVVDDSAYDLFIGNRAEGDRTWDGHIGWVRVSNSIRYTVNFTPAAFGNPPTRDADTVLLLRMTEGSGHPQDSSGNNNHGTLTNGTWVQISPFREWTEYDSNPIVPYGIYSFDSAGIKSPSITEYDADTWIMFFVTKDGTGWNGVSYATAPKTEPHNWTRHTSRILTGGHRGVSGIKVSSTWYIYFHEDNTGIQLATGSDLSSLTDQGVVLAGTDQVGDFDRFVVHPMVLYDSDTSIWHMYYDGRSDSWAGEAGAIGHATSSDGISWTRDTANNPIVEPDTDHFFEYADVGFPSVVSFGGQYYLFYGGYDGNGSPYIHYLCYATSSSLNGPWTKYAYNPILAPGAIGTWRETSVHDPEPLVSGGMLYLYFTGGANNNANEQIGYAYE